MSDASTTPPTGHDTTHAHEADDVRWVNIVRELGICDESGHVQSCGYDENEACFCSTLPLRLKFLAGVEAAVAAERERIAAQFEAMAGPWGRDQMWMTTGTRVADLAASIVRGDQ